MTSLLLVRGGKSDKLLPHHSNGWFNFRGYDMKVEQLKVLIEGRLFEK